MRFIIALGLAFGLSWAVHAEEAPRRVGALGVLIDPAKPMNIEAEEFQASRGGGSNDLITFERNVIATQEGLRLQCDWLEASYDARGGSPQRITARGSVKMSQANTRLECAELIYENEHCRISCADSQARASVTHGEDVMRGSEIEMDLCAGTLKVRGRASIELRPASPPQGSAGAQPE